MKLLLRFYREFVLQFWRPILIALLLTATLSQGGFAFSMLGKWLVDDVLEVGRAAAVQVDTNQGSESPDAETEPTTTDPAGPVSDDPSPSSTSEPVSSSTTVASSAPPVVDPDKARGLLYFLLISLGLHFVVALMGGIAGFLVSSVGQRVLFRVRMALQRRLLGMSMAFYNRQQTGQLMVRVLEDANGAQANTVNLPVNIAAHLVSLAVGLWLLWRLNPTMTMIALGVLPLYAIGSAVFMVPLRHNTDNVRRANADLQSLIEERLSLISTIKSYAQEMAEGRRFFRRLRQNLAITWRQNALNTGLSVTLMLISGLGATAILLIGFINIRAGRMQLGETLAFYQMTALLFGPITALANTYLVIQTSSVLLQRIYDVLDTHPDLAEPESPVEPEVIRGDIAFENVSLRYSDHSAIAVNDVTFTAPAGSRVALLGTSGSGRTTIANLLVRLFDPDTGTVRLDGVDLRDYRLERVRRAVAVASQDARVFAGSIHENIAFGAEDATDDQVARAADVAGAHDPITQLPDGYQTRVGRGGMELPSTLLQRIAIARTLISDPAVLVFDDSASALSDTAEINLYDRISEAFANRTQLVITNRVRTAERCDQVIVMRDGQIIEQGNPEDLLARKGTYWRMFIHQTHRPGTIPVERVAPAGPDD
ncbi:MAG: ABC transporter ATP-binding protein [Phycisphaeraceae bacterium]|nr:ABC transporter ATP-binding protein [Phycisphaeraceae bacterium]